MAINLGALLLIIEIRTTPCLLSRFLPLSLSSLYFLFQRKNLHPSLLSVNKYKLPQAAKRDPPYEVKVVVHAPLIYGCILSTRSTFRTSSVPSSLTAGHQRSSQPPCIIFTPRPSSSSSSSSSPPRLWSPPRQPSTASAEHTRPTSAAWPPSSRPRPPPPRASRRPAASGTGLTGREPPRSATGASALRPAPPASPAPSGRRRGRARTARRRSSSPATAPSVLPISLELSALAPSVGLTSWVRDSYFKQLDLHGFSSCFCKNGVTKEEHLLCVVALFHLKNSS